MATNRRKARLREVQREFALDLVRLGRNVDRVITEIEAGLANVFHPLRVPDLGGGPMDWPHCCCNPPHDDLVIEYTCVRCGTTWERVAIAALDRKPRDRRMVAALDRPTTAWVTE